MIKNILSSPIERRGFMLVLSSPSGAGKTTIAREVLNLEDRLELSISVTTRSKRPSEKEGKDYYFVDEATFNNMINEDQFLESAYVYGYHYGTPRASIERQLSAGTDVIFDIDWQGTQQLKQRSISDLVSVFILPPSLEDLKKRLHHRGEDSEEIVGLRMSKAADEISHWAEYDYIIINQNVKDSILKVRSILEAERLKRRRQTGLSQFIHSLRGE
ncbi:MAG: guanylate kinase [Proteobacteria bacterium]|nr:guanylate kinase [Pseudomonadota bacterium]